jgi:hypothetical protein
MSMATDFAMGESFNLTLADVVILNRLTNDEFSSVLGASRLLGYKCNTIGNLKFIENTRPETYAFRRVNSWHVKGLSRHESELPAFSVRYCGFKVEDGDELSSMVIIKVANGVLIVD